MEPYTIIDTSSVAMIDEPFIFNDIVEKANETVVTSKSCNEMGYNLQEYSNFINEFASEKNLKLGFGYQYSCADNPVIVTFVINLTSTRIFMNRSMTVSKTFA